MNIPDISGAGSLGPSPEPSRSESEPVKPDPAPKSPDAAIPQEKQAPMDGQRDEYVQTLANTIKGTMYDVNDVRDDKVSNIRSQILEGRYNPSGEKIAEKIVDILLPMGRKTLSVYKKLQ